MSTGSIPPNPAFEGDREEAMRQIGEQMSGKAPAEEKVSYEDRMAREVYQKEQSDRAESRKQRESVKQQAAENKAIATKLAKDKERQKREDPRNYTTIGDKAVYDPEGKLKDKDRAELDDAMRASKQRRYDATRSV